MVCKSNLFKHFLMAIKVVELATDSGNKFQVKMIRLQKKVSKRVILGFMFTSQNQSMSTQIVISFNTYAKIIKIDINQAIANFVCKNKIELQPSILQRFQIVQTITVRRRNVTTNTGPSSEYFLNRFNRFDIAFQMWRPNRSIIFQLVQIFLLEKVFKIR